MLDVIRNGSHDGVKKMNVNIEKKKLAPHVARLYGLDVDRSKRIYKALSKLSDKAVTALTAKDMKSFSIHTDKMRPLMNYIVTNSVTLTEHLANDNIQQTIENELIDFVPKLTHNLKIIEHDYYIK